MHKLSENNLQMELHRLSIGISALGALSIMIPDTIDQESTVSSEQISCLLKCVECNLQSASKNISAAIQS